MLNANTWCLPTWHARIAPFQGANRHAVSVGRLVDDKAGSVPAYLRYIDPDPDTLRKQAAAALGRSVSRDVYTLARHAASEHGSGTPEEKMLLALSTIEQARQRGISPYQLLACGNKRGLCRYGPIHAPVGWTATCLAQGGTQSYCKSPFRRWAATTLDPGVDDIMVAELALSGRTRNWARNANDQYSGSLFKKYDHKQKIAALTDKARSGHYWVGHLPGVNHMEVFAYRTLKNVPWNSAVGQALIGGAAEALEAGSPAWTRAETHELRLRKLEAEIPMCPPGSDVGGAHPVVVAVASIAVAGGLAYGLAYLAQQGWRPFSPGV